MNPLVKRKEQLDQKHKVNFKIYGVTTWLTTTIHILPNISQSKGSQTMKFGQLIEYKKVIVFLQNHAKDEVVRLTPDLFLFLKKALYEVKANGLQISVNIFDTFQYEMQKKQTV